MKIKDAGIVCIARAVFLKFLIESHNIDWRQGWRSPEIPVAQLFSSIRRSAFRTRKRHRSFRWMRFEVIQFVAALEIVFLQPQFDINCHATQLCVPITRSSDFSPLAVPRIRGMPPDVCFPWICTFAAFTRTLNNSCHMLRTEMATVDARCVSSASAFFSRNLFLPFMCQNNSHHPIADSLH